MFFTQFVRRLANWFVSHELAYHDSAREQNDDHGQEEQYNDDRRVVDPFAHPVHFGHTAELGCVTKDRIRSLKSSDWPAGVVAVTLHKVGPALLRVRTVVECRQRNECTQRPNRDNAHKSRSPVGQVRSEWIHDGHEAVTRDSHKREHTRQNAHHLHERVDFAEQAAQSPLLALANHHLHPHARVDNGQVAYGQV